MNTRVRSILAALLLLLTGGALALAVEHAIALHHSPRNDQQQAPNAALHDALMSQLDAAIGLTPAQRDSVHAILTRHQGMVDSAWSNINRHMHLTMDSVRIAVERTLEPAQIPHFREWMKQHHNLGGM